MPPKRDRAIAKSASQRAERILEAVQAEYKRKEAAASVRADSARPGSVTQDMSSTLRSVLIYTAISLTALIGGYLMGAANMGHGDPTFADQLGKTIANMTLKLVKLVFIVAPLMLLFMSLLRQRKVRLAMTVAYESVETATSVVRRYAEFLERSDVSIGDTPQPVSLVVGLALLGSCIFASAVVMSSITLMGLLWSS